jgi:hypothetical protein
VKPTEDHWSSTQDKYIQISKVHVFQSSKATGVSSNSASAKGLLSAQDDIASRERSSSTSSASAKGAAVDNSLFSSPSYHEAFIKNNNINMFYYQLPFRKVIDKKSENEFLDLWVRRFVLTTDISLPNGCRRAEIVSTQEIELNPAEAALDIISERNKSLERQISILRATPDGGASQNMTMAISGTVDAAVNGGLKNYTLMLTEEYRKQYPEIAEDIDSCVEKSVVIEKLKTAFREHFRVLAVNVELHRIKCQISMRPLHDHIEKAFVALQESIMNFLN